MPRLVLAACAVWALAVGGCEQPAGPTGGGPGPAGPPGPAPEDVLALDPGEVAAAYRADPEAAYQRYQGRMVELTARVRSTATGSDGPTAALSAQPGVTVTVRFRPVAAPAVRDLKEGQAVRVQGRFAGAMVVKDPNEVAIRLSDCVLVPAGGGP